MSEAMLDKLSVALKTEMVGYSYYSEAAAMISDEHGKNVFRHLAKEELDHIKTLTRIADSVEAGRGWIASEKDAPGASEEADKGLPVFPETNELLEKLRDNETDINAINIALDAEEKAIAFYSGMLKAAVQNDEIEVLTSIVEMEKGHYDLLRWERDALSNSGFWLDQMEFSVEKER